eukprot:TRINITY_DN17465_c0_g2_i1.p1 TRINITY_DN17465_c0_g2~~TRINITY_DN17465_c0_g2_i1.p1  ORF type:complete len:139 (+),score=11.49 TRINITY_DN17465_c0_g2_i1:65-481(+)
MCIRDSIQYVLLRRAMRPSSLSVHLSNQMTELLEWILPLYALGNFFFNLRVLDFPDKETLIILCIGVVNALVPMEAINKMIFPPRQKTMQEKSYWDAMLIFDEDYDRANPATRRKAIEDLERAFMKTVQRSQMYQISA